MVVVNRASRIAKEASIDAPSTNPMTAAVPTSIHPSNQHISFPAFQYPSYRICPVLIGSTVGNNNTIESYPSPKTSF